MLPVACLSSFTAELWRDAQWFGSLPALFEDLISVPNTHFKSPQLPVTPASRELDSGLWAPTHTDRHL